MISDDVRWSKIIPDDLRRSQVIPTLEVTKASLFIVFPPAQVVIPALEVTKVCLFIVSLPLHKW